MKKNILFVIDSLQSGGAEKSLVSLLSLFDYQKYNVDLLMFSQNGLYKSLLPEEVKILDVPYILKAQRKSIRYLLDNQKYRELYTRLRISLSLRNPYKRKNMHSAQVCWKWFSKDMKQLDYKYDIAIAYSQGMPTYFVAEKVRARKKICWINTDYKSAPYNKKYDEKYYEQYNKIVAVSTYNKEVFIRELPSMQNKTLVIYDIISPTLISSMSLEKEGFKDNYQGLKLLTIGRLVESKGYDLAIEASYKLKKDGIDFKWYVIGEGILKEKLQKIISQYGLEENFIFLGTYQNPYTFLNEIDIYVQPSRFEGFGLAIAEAKILNKPIIATNFTVVHDQIKNLENGIIVKMNAEAIYQGIKELINNATLRNNLASNLQKEKKGSEKEIEKVYKLIEDAG